MKKLCRYIILLVFSFLFIDYVNAESINSINMDIQIDKNGDAYVTEVWDVDATEKTEYYHAYYNIQGMKINKDPSISDLKVRDESNEYSYINWNINGSLQDKAYHYGYNYDYNGVELCFGKSSYGHHKYTLTYKINGFVHNTTDGKQVIYWTLLNKINPAPKEFEIVISADEAFSSTLDVWGFGYYGGEASVYDGKIYLSNKATNEVFSSSDYMTLLAEFDEPIFNTEYNLDYSFDEILDMAKEGSTAYSNKKSIISTIFDMITMLIPIMFFVFMMIMAAKSSQSAARGGTYKLDFGQTGKKVPKDVNMFRELPCNKDLFRAYWVATQYGLVKKKTDFLGAILLKWHKEGTIKIESKEKGTVFKKENTCIVFDNPELNSSILVENDLYRYMYEASKDGILESKEFEKWCKNHYSKILNWFDEVLDYETRELVKEEKITKGEKTSLGVFKSTIYTVDESMMEEAKQMGGLKKFFNEFDNMSDKEAIEVMLWEEYLMYAQIFGVADKVAKQFKKLYPDVITDNDYNTIIYFNTVSHSSVSAASSAKARAESYSSGGGGFSSGGGGGGSFGGGGGSFGGGSR